ncbi:UNVERIFIED_CONTAM: hypothetical protein Scaly_2021300 [Sesamum calycinum]|uniref:Uncharacterized protein n=1 Tax=Sesamum calycinum TaxID=2727403 RepID=A0AAW2N1P8_9LAMI
MVFDAVGPSYFASSHEDIPDDGTRSYPVDAGPSSYCYGGGPYDYDESGKDDVDLEYCKFCGDARNKPSRDHPPEEVPKSRIMFGWTFAHIVLRRHAFDRCVYLKSLIEELLQLWHVGVRTYDHATDRAFIMRAALMWTVNDLPAYGMASGWSIAGLWDARSVWMIQEHSIYSTIMSTGVPTPLGRGRRGQGRGRGPPSPPRAELADPAPVTPSSMVVFQPPQIPANSGAVGSYAAGASSSQAPARSWDAPPP